MIDFLMQIHTKKCIRSNLPIGPPHIPISNPNLPFNSPSQLLRNLLDDGVLGITDIDNNFFSF